MRRTLAKWIGREPALVDAAIEAYVAWREACGAVDNAYQRWDSSQTSTSEVSFGLYQLALDSEETAASTYGQLMADLAHLAETEKINEPPSFPTDFPTWL